MRSSRKISTRAHIKLKNHEVKFDLVGPGRGWPSPLPRVLVVVFKLSRGGSSDIISLMQIYLPLLIQ